MANKILKFIPICMYIFFIAGCSKEEYHANAKKELLILQPTEAAIQYRENSVRPAGKQHLQEGYFDDIAAQMKLEPRNIFPKDSSTGEDIVLTNKLTKLDDINTYSLYALQENNVDYNSVTLYIHGGAYMFGITDAHVKFCDKLATAMHSKVYMPLYPLCTQTTFKEAYDYMSEVYELVLKENKTVYIMGDSAGGGFTLGFTEYLKEQNKKMPHKLVLLSPWLNVDSTCVEGIKEYEAVDITLACYGADECGKLWAGDTDRKDYRISPIYGCLDKLPDILLISGSDEITMPTSQTLFNNVTNTNIKFVITVGLWHVYPVYNIPERESTIELINEFAYDNWNNT